ncbi:MAG: FAD-dependent oxidoreductase, partial [Dehalococcoidia bacterium]
MSEKQRVVVLGNGMAGARFIEELLANSQPDQFDITVFGDEPCGNYNRILLSSVLAGKHSANDIVMNSVEWYAQNRVTLHAGVKATNIDTTSQIVSTDDGRDTPYDQLVIATGSTAFIPPFEGARKPDGDLRDGIFTFRTLEDTERMIEYAKKAKSVAVIGGGLLGLEAAKGLMNHVETVHVVHVMDRLMETQLDAQAGEILNDLLSQQGMNFHFEKFTESV